jgi:hypothetical protein
VTDPRAHYEAGVRRLRAEAAAWDARSARISHVRVAVVVGFLIVMGLTLAGRLGAIGWIGAGALALTFGALVVVHGRIVRRHERALAAQRYHERGLLRLDGALDELPARPADVGDHPYAADLDVFGPSSLLTLVDATETRFGEERLVRLLAGPPDDEPWPEAVLRRQRAVRELAGKAALRERLSVLGATLGGEGRKPDPTPLFQWAEQGGRTSRVPLALAVFARVWPFVTVGAVVVGKLLGWPVLATWGPYFVAFVTSIAVRPLVTRVAGPVLAHEGGVGAYVEVFDALEKERFESPLLVEAQALLLGSERTSPSTREMRRLASLSAVLEARENEVFRLFVAPIFLWELNGTVALEVWRLRTGPRLRAWFAALGEVEALASLGQLAFDNPSWVMPRLVAEPRLAAKKLAHPLIPPAKRVGNDVEIAGPGCALVVTGSNMAGKSTLLRALGLFAVLGRAGAPVCAEDAEMGPLRVAASMRVSDSLKEGTSRFYAELLRLRRIVDMARKGPGVLFLLDEILHGTNTRERLIGARGVVRKLLEAGALGAVSTHDLALGELEQEYEGRVTNVHFEEQVQGDVMTFDYVLRRGVVSSSNALRLMKAVGLEVE